MIARALAGASLATALASFAWAVPLTPAEVGKLCGEAEGPAHCGRLVEAEQLKRLPGLAARDGNALRLSLFPSGNVTFNDVDAPSGGKSFALWDYFSEINAAILWTTQDDDTGFLIVQRAGGRQTALPAEPVLAPDRQRIVTADFCAERCGNRLTVWRVSREGVTREAFFEPPEKWIDATARWKDPQTVVITYSREGAPQPATLERRLAEPGWSR